MVFQAGEAEQESTAPVIRPRHETRCTLRSSGAVSENGGAIGIHDDGTTARRDHSALASKGSDVIEGGDVPSADHLSAHTPRRAR